MSDQWWKDSKQTVESTEEGLLSFIYLLVRGTDVKAAVLQLGSVECSKETKKQ